MNQGEVMQKKKMILIGCIFLFIVGIGVGLWILFENKSQVEVDKDYDALNLDDVTSLMFVAHPDDDALWGGAHLVQNKGKFLVVCITCGVRKDRALEFETAMKKLNNPYLMLGWPDKTNGEKDNWDTSREGISKDIKNILALKDWDLVVTHNPDGEYGHIHHIMTNNMVTAAADKEKLMYFGHYYKADVLPEYENTLSVLSDLVLEEKIDLIKVYKTQDFVFDMFGHMNKYESWVSYEDWYQE